MKAVYLDHNASSPLRPAALQAMLPWLQGVTGNPSSVHRDGCRARAALDEARATLAGLLGARPEELIFTSGGTESNNLAIKGSWGSWGAWTSGELITLASEHPSVLAPARELAARPGLSLVELLPESSGQIELESLESALCPRTRLVSIQAVNHETGAIQPIEELGRRLAEHPALFHVDAVQAFCRRLLPVKDWKIDLLSCSSHKIGGPVGIGALYVRSGCVLAPQQLGGAQEHGLRAGTESVSLAAGFAAAAVEAERQREEEEARHRVLRRFLIEELRRRFPEVIVNGPEEHVVPGTLSVAFPGVDLDSLLVQLDLSAVRVSSGAACASGARQPSAVLAAMRLPEEVRNSTVRISMGPETSREGLEHMLSALARAVPNARK